MKTIYLMRHGETDWNRELRLQGQQDVPLNDAGRAQAVEAGQRLRRAGLRFDRVISSSLCRASETAMLAAGLPAEAIETDRRIIEMGFGPYDGTPYGLLEGSIWDFLRDPAHHPRPAGMETEEEMLARFGDFLRSLQADPRDETLLIVTHGVAIRTLLFLIDPTLGEAAWSLPIENCVFYRTTLDNGTFSKPELVRL